MTEWLDKIVGAAPGIAGMLILALSFIRYLKTRDDRSERDHKRFSADLRHVTESSERKFDNMSKAHERVVDRIMGLKPNGNGKGAAALLALLLVACSPTRIQVDQRGAKDSTVEINTSSNAALRGAGDDPGVHIGPKNPPKEKPDAKKD